jgi:hypothetical protein
MRTAIKAWAYKSATFLLALMMMGYGLIASIVIFAEMVGIVTTMGYTKEATAVVLGAIGLVLIWLVTLLGSSASALIQAGIKQATKAEEDNG